MRRAILGKLALTRTPDPIRPTRRGTDPNRHTRWGIFWKLTLTYTPDPIQPTPVRGQLTRGQVTGLAFDRGAGDQGEQMTGWRQMTGHHKQCSARRPSARFLY